MANRVKFIIIAKDAYTAVARKVGAATDKMTSKFGKMGKELRKTTNRFVGLAVAAAGFFGVRKFFSEGAKFQDSIADLAAITGAAGKDLAFFKDESLRLAKVAKVSASETAGAFKLVASAKAELLKDPKALSNVTEQVLLLANASGLDLHTAALTVTESLNQFSAGAKEAAKFVNILAAGSKFGASEIAETGEAVVKSGVAAKQAKLDFAELNGVIQVLAQRGIKGAIAGTQLKTSLIKLEAQGIRKIKPSVVGFTQALKNLQDMELGTLELSKLFGLEAINTGFIMIESAKAIEIMTGKLRGTQIAADQAKIRLSTFSAVMRGVGININESLIKVFDKLEEKKLFTNLANDFADFVGSLNEADIQNIAETIKVMADAAVILAKAMGSVAKSFKVVGTIIGEISAAVSLGEPRALLALTSPQALLLEVARKAAPQFKEPKRVGGKISLEEIKSFTGLDLQALVIDPLRGAVDNKLSADLNINITAPIGVVESVKTTARSPKFRIGTNMITGAVPG